MKLSDDPPPRYEDVVLRTENQKTIQVWSEKKFQAVIKTQTRTLAFAFEEVHLLLISAYCFILLNQLSSISLFTDNYLLLNKCFWRSHHQFSSNLRD